MKRLIFLFLDFLKHDFHPRTFLLVLIWAALLVAINFSIELEDNYIDTWSTLGPRFLGYWGLYLTAYFGTVAIVLVSKLDSKKIKELPLRFWLISVSGITVLAADSGFVYHEYVLDWIAPPIRASGFVFALLSNASEFITIALPLFAVNYWFVPNQSDNLGINKKEIELMPFFLILLVIAPFIFMSAFEAGLNNYYPTFRYGNAASALGLDTWVPVSLYEFFYGLDFFNVELMFRGFMVIGVMSFLGREAVLPMAVFYCSLHFGKPLAEAISSLFGGYILGAIAFQTRAIWGGVIVHMGLAWLMELSAFVVKGYLTD